MTSPQNPLFARVIVNRIWEHLFGQGLVTTVDNFGVMGDRPSHPELLDYLASRFIQDGWSTKRLIRTIVLSHAYQLGSGSSVAYENIDPDDRLVWRHAPRRLEAEEIRDAILATSGELQLQPPGTPLVNSLPMVEIRDNGPESKKINETADRALCRSVYLPLLRGVTPSALAAFDPVDQTLVSGQRESTTVPTQALFMLNSAFVGREADALTRRLLAEKERSDSDKIKLAWQLILNRTPERGEIIRTKKFIAQYAQAYVQTKPFEPAQPERLVAAVAETDNVADGKAKLAAPINPDDVDTTEVPVSEEEVRPATPQEAAWLSFIRSLYASAEFRFVR